MRDGSTPYPSNIQWHVAMPRLALLTEGLLLVGAFSMHATDVLTARGEASLGLAYQMLWMHVIGFCGLIINGSAMLWVVRRGWRHTRGMAARYETSGAYLGLDAPFRYQLFLAAVLSIVLSSVCARWLMSICLATPWTDGLPDVLPPLEFAVFNSFYGCMSVYACELLNDRVALSRWREQRAEQLTAQAQLDTLRSQLEPHMLFNTLANVVDLMEEDPPAARAMLNHLISFLRATLEGSRASQHDLKEEFARLADYLSIMKVRMGDRLRVRLDLPSQLGNQQVPAMVLQPLVENAVLHGLSPRRAGGELCVEATVDQSRLILTVSNSGAPPMALTRSPGFGIACVRERLRVLYGDHAAFELTHDEDQEMTRAIVTLPRHATP